MEPGGIGQGIRRGLHVEVLRRRGFMRAPWWAGSESTVYRDGRASRGAEGWRVEDQGPAQPAAHGGRGVSEGRVAFDLGPARRSSSARREASTATSWTRGRDFRAAASGSVSVIAPRATDGEAWAKPYFIQAASGPRCTSRRSSACASATVGRMSRARGFLDCFAIKEATDIYECVLRHG